LALHVPPATLEVPWGMVQAYWALLQHAAPRRPNKSPVAPCHCRPSPRRDVASVGYGPGGKPPRRFGWRPGLWADNHEPVNPSSVDRPIWSGTAPISRRPCRGHRRGAGPLISLTVQIVIRPAVQSRPFSWCFALRHLLFLPFALGHRPRGPCSGPTPASRRAVAPLGLGWSAGRAPGARAVTGPGPSGERHELCCRCSCQTELTSNVFLLAPPDRNATPRHRTSWAQLRLRLAFALAAAPPSPR